MSERAVEARTEIAWLRVALAELLDVGHPGHRVGTGKECLCVVHENARNLLRAARLAATPAPREDGWEELRRKIEALLQPSGDYGLAGAGHTAHNGAIRAVLAILARLAVARGEPPASLDFDRLLDAIEATRLEDPGPWHVDFPKTRTRLAKEIGRNYRALATPATPEPNQ